MSQSPSVAQGVASASSLPPLPGKTTDLGAIATPKVFWTPLVFTLALGLLSFVPRIHGNATLKATFWSAAALLLAGQSALFFAIRRSASVGSTVGFGATRSMQIVLKAQHYVQALCQIAVYLYWGYFWPPIFDHGWLIVAQIVFAYAFDMLLSWSRRATYVLGFGVFPIILSTNLFLWFKDDWFYMQFLLIAVGFIGKEFVRWNRGGKSVHIFNPSAFSLGLFSLVLLATGTTQLTWAPEIATTLTFAPYIYSYLFVVGLVVMYFFSITPTAATAAAVLFGWSAVYMAFTGVPYFVDSEIPIAVFLGLHLLISDPSTSPRTPIGRTIFGALYGVGVFSLYGLLSYLDAPTLYDKLLCVPILNLLVIGIDRITVRNRKPVVALHSKWIWLTRNAVHMTIWIVFFAAMTALGKTDGRHIGDRVPFWQQACRDNKANACARLLNLEASYCGDNSAWACNELGTHYAEGRLIVADRERSRAFYSKACELRFPAACTNLLHPEEIIHAAPHLLDLRLLLREGGLNLTQLSEADLYIRACDHGWTFACNTGGAR